MALSPELEKLVATLPEADREGTRKMLEEGVLRQQDYSRKMNELTAKEKEWTTWHTSADTQYKAAMTEVKSLKETISALEKAKAAGSIEDDLSGDEDAAITKALREARTELALAKERQSLLEQTVHEVNQKIEKGELLTATKFQEELAKQGDNLGAAIFEVIDLQQKCQQEFGKSLDRTQLIAEAQRRNGDLKGAYEALTGDFRIEKRRTELEAEYEQKYNDRVKAANLPIDQGSGGEPNLGPLQARLAKKDTGIPDDVPADGSGRLASLIGNEFRAEGKG
jgi:rRNA maturation endonuclease Nob1